MTETIILLGGTVTILAHLLYWEIREKRKAKETIKQHYEEAMRV